MKLKRIELKRLSLDMAFSGGKCDQTENFLRYLQEICEVYELQIVGLIPVGSGGGWPEVTFRGTEKNLTKFSIAFHDDDELGLDMIKDYSRDDSDGGFYVAVDERFTTKGDREFINDDGTFKEW
jgi:hypothetical protein